MKKNILKTVCLFAATVAIGSNNLHAQTFDISGSGDFGNSHPSYPSRNAVDGNTSFGSRWAATFEGGAANLFVDLGTRRTVDDIGVAWGRGDQRSYDFEVRARAGTSGSWARIFRGRSSGKTAGIESYNVTDFSARQVRVKVFSNSARTNWADITEFEVYGTGGRSGSNNSRDSSSNIPDTPSAPEDVTPTLPPPTTPTPPNDNSGDFGLSSNRDPWDNFDLSRWAIDTPAPRDNDGCRAERTWDYQWSESNPLDSSSAPFFFTHSDGGMRFVTRIDGQTTNSSCNSGFVRSELREMIRQGNRNIDDTGVTRNNWKLGYQPGNDSNWGGVNGRMDATLRVNRVTTTGDSGQIGRVIVGQIHATGDEPLRLYYRKRSGQSKGCIYFGHEIRNSDDVWYEMIGDRSCTSGPSNGIELDELFSYSIINDDENISVTIRRGDRNGPIIAQRTINMNNLNSGYDRSDEAMYFKAGAYTQNDSGNGRDGDIVTFYRLNVSHD